MFTWSAFSTFSTEPLLNASSVEDSNIINYNTGGKTGDSDDLRVVYDIQATIPTSMPFWRACLLPGVIPVSYIFKNHLLWFCLQVNEILGFIP